MRMFRNNWIRVPLIAASMWIASQLLANRIIDPDANHLRTIIVFGLIFGFLVQTLNWLRVRDKFGEVGQEVTDTHQMRALTLMQDKSRALETCKLAIESLPDLKLRSVVPELSGLKARSKMKRVAWGFTWGNLISVRLVEVAEHLTEINIESKPLMPTVLVDSGEAWTTTEQLVAEIKKLDSQPSKEALNDGVEMLQDLTMRPINVHR